mmetsp:Transcript_38958/g.125115  ORF Transcript_38958/g.125115 Transcript_38958/m.125115 type:complete len:364 (+) Transcript_38958:357-1448(+)
MLQCGAPPGVFRIVRPQPGWVPLRSGFFGRLVGGQPPDASQVGVASRAAEDAVHLPLLRREPQRPARGGGGRQDDRAHPAAPGPAALRRHGGRHGAHLALLGALRLRGLPRRGAEADAERYLAAAAAAAGFAGGHPRCRGPCVTGEGWRRPGGGLAGRASLAGAGTCAGSPLAPRRVAGGGAERRAGLGLGELRRRRTWQVRRPFRQLGQLPGRPRPASWAGGGARPAGAAGRGARGVEGLPFGNPRRLRAAAARGLRRRRRRRRRGRGRAQAESWRRGKRRRGLRPRAAQPVQCMHHVGRCLRPLAARRRRRCRGGAALAVFWGGRRWRRGCLRRGWPLQQLVKQMFWRFAVEIRRKRGDRA